MNHGVPKAMDESTTYDAAYRWSSLWVFDDSIAAVLNVTKKRLGKRRSLKAVVLDGFV
jgi:hypothetical protein